MSRYIIALDVDETLLKDDKSLSNRNKQAIQLCKSLGAYVAISSARGYGSCEKIAREISADFVCCQSGNMIVDMKTGETIYKKGFSKDEIIDMIKTFSRFTQNIIVDSTRNLYGGIGDETAKFWGVIPMELESIPQIEVFKACVWYDENVEEEIVKYCSDHKYVCRPMRGSPFMLITPQNSDKYYALEKLANILNVDIKNVMAFGDDDSDLMSIEKVGIGVAMANSRETVLQKAKNVTSSNNDDGVAEFLEKFFKL